MTKGTRVVHCKREPFDVYIGRPTQWGNPYVVGRDGSRAEVIEKYRRWVRSQPGLMAAVGDLKGLALGCWCSPRPCHGDVLAELADAVPAISIGKWADSWRSWNHLAISEAPKGATIGWLRQQMINNGWSPWQVSGGG